MRPGIREHGNREDGASPAEGGFELRELVVRRAGEVNYRSRKITGAAAEGFATPG